tara:strand:+ start:4795 stop:4941 length:147 start_codon:yes stop_codon:yes gene_type:complete
MFVMIDLKNDTVIKQKLLKTGLDDWCENSTFNRLFKTKLDGFDIFGIY